jgi:sec-independent protein translocase protein TatC
MGNASAEALQGEPVRRPLQRHIADLKRRFYWCGFTFIVACVITFPHADEMIAWLKKPYLEDLIFYAPSEAIFAAIKVALLGGITLSMPVFLYHLWKFIEPALLPGERRWFVPFLAIASVFFAMGVSFGNFVIVPLALQFMLQFGIDRALVPQLGVGFYVDFNVKFLLTFGFAFELPLGITLLSRLRVVTPDLLARYRKHAIMVNLILSAILTPTSDLFNLLLMAGPLIILYEVGILSARLFGRPPARPSDEAEEMVEPVKVPEGTAGKRILFCVALVAGVTHGAALAQLSPGGMLEELGPEGFVSIQSLALGEEQTVYAGSFGKGVFKSEDGGKTWTAVNEGMTDPYVYVVVTTPDKTVFAGTLRGGIFRSKNGGKSWRPMNAGLDRLETQVLLAHQGVLYAGTGSGVYRSKDGGERWVADNQGLSNLLVRALVVDHQGTMYAGTTGMGLYRKLAGSGQWTRMTPSRLSHPRDQLPANFVRALVVDRMGTLYAGTADNGVYVSMDRGETWRIIGGQLANASVRGIVIDESSWFVGTGVGMYRSSDHGKTWIQINNGLTERAIQSFAVGKDGTVYAGTSGGVFKTEDHGAHWVSTNQGIATSRKPAPRH